ncbi:uncharacterized protein LOC144924581 [Branchiostoma floridae x Branchiostoma belcheri]
MRHCYPPERISATAHHVIAPRNQAPTGRVGVCYTQYTHAFWLNCLKSAIFEVVRIEQFTFRVWTAIWTSSGQFVLRAINLKEYRADFAFEESIIHEAVCEQWKSSSTCFNKISAQDLLSGQVRTEESRHHCN